MWITWVGSIAALIFALYQALSVMKKDGGTDRMKEISKAIQEGRLAELIADKGRESDAAGRAVHITSRLSPEVFEIAIRDDGHGFDWRSLPAVEPENLLAFNGRGIFLTKIYFDEVRYNERGNEVTLVKGRML
jgi:anti-sigma regulatory factor (Ser/Thr protein kinase)